MTQDKLSSSLQKLPQLLRSIERNRWTAYAHFRRLAFLQLVYIGSGGSGGGDPTDSYGELVLQQELDQAIDFLQSLLDQQEQALGGSASDRPGGGGGTEEPCQSDLTYYQAALAAKDFVTAKRYLDAYTECMQTHSGTPLPGTQNG